MSPFDLVVLAHHDNPAPQALDMVARAEAAGAAAAVWSPRELAVEVDDSGARILHRGNAVLPGAVLPQGINRSFAFCRPALRVLEGIGTAVVNSVESSEFCIDKVETTRLLAGAGVPVLPTRAHPWGAQAVAMPPWGSPIVTKPAAGSNGDGVKSHATVDAARRHLSGDRLLGPSGAVGTELLQPMADGAGEDVRVVVIDGVARSIIRRRALTGFVTNGANATAEAVDDPEAAQVAIDGTVVLGLTYGAVDVIRHQGRAVVLEVNCWPRDLAYVGELSGVDLVDEVVQVALSQRTGLAGIGG